MITKENATVAQQKWSALIDHYFADIAKSGKITHKQLKIAHDKFLELRVMDKKYKTGYPIWLIMNNQIERGVYQLPNSSCVEPPATDDPDKSNTFYPEYISELEKFNLSYDKSMAVDLSEDDPLKF